MLKSLRGRINRNDEGFTLIELMVVVLIIGILMAIAIPTFLGAKSKANDRSAQENARNALTTEKSYYTDNQAYTATAATLLALEPALGFQTTAPAAGKNQVQVAVPATGTNGTNDVVVLTTQASSGNCFYILDEAVSGTVQAAGTVYATQVAVAGACPATPAYTLTPTQGKAAVGSWGTTW